MRYQHLFFDLDHTLWDFERNSAETLGELFETFQLAGLCGVDCEAFVARYQAVNFWAWDLYNRRQISRDQLRDVRFRRVFNELGVAEARHPAALGAAYLRLCPTKTHLLPHAHQTLTYLRGRGYVLHVLTNGFDQTQHLKLNGSGLLPYFQEVITSETTGHRKPDAAYFHYALQRARVPATAALMIGDSLEADVRGAQACGWDTVFFNPGRQSHQDRPTYEVHCLSELQTML